MILKLIEEGRKVDEVIFYDTGVEFQAIYSVRDRMKSVFNKNGILYTELKPERPFLYDMLERPKQKRNGENVFGDGWCGGGCRWGTIQKLHTINKYLPKDKTDITMYVGIAADEIHRLKKLDEWKIAPLQEWKMTEADCLKYCYEKGFEWKEGDVRLYDVLDRVSCWCCRNKNMKELRNIYLKLPTYWRNLKDLQEKIGVNMKGYRVDAYYGDLGDLNNLQKMWEDEQKQISVFDYLGENDVYN